MTHAAESRAGSLESTQLEHQACAHTYRAHFLSFIRDLPTLPHWANPLRFPVSRMCTSKTLWSTKVSSKQSFSQRPKPRVTHHRASCGCANAEAAELELSGGKLLFSMWANIHSRWALKVFTVWECWHRVPSVGVAVRQPWHCDNAFSSTLTFDGWIRKRMKGPNSTQGLNLHRRGGGGGLLWKTADSSFVFWIVIVFHGGRLCTLSLRHSCLTPSLGWPGFCQNATWSVFRWERRIRNIPAKSRGCQCLIRASPPPYYFASKSESVPLPTDKSWLHSRWFISKATPKDNQINCNTLQPTSWWMILPYDAGVGPTDGLAHQIDVAALVDRDILGYVGDPGGD